MIKIGITGLIGSGKTTISQIFEILEIPIYNTDLRAKELMHEDYEIKEKIIQNFGSNSYIDNSLNKEYISKIIFSDNNARNIINSIVHPKVIDDFKNWLIEKNNENYKIAGIESALLYQANIHKILDYIILVSSNDDTLSNRIMKRDNISQKQALLKIKTQKAELVQNYKVDFEIKNDNTESVLLQILNILNKLDLATK
ncbi:MAG TPA: dephospho-CoA kinase [Bacteroidales bacterium]|nr:dephospho-CoA kinase [Bacteroidales bacterium]HQB21738.1 dephospho-CoA kinase [Bacteroidales bacterium]